MPINYTCPHCGHHGQTSDAMAGHQGKCPQCSEKLRVPTASVGSVEFHPAPKPYEPPPPETLNEQQWRNEMLHLTRKLVADQSASRGYLGCLLVVLIVAVLAILFFGFQIEVRNTRF